MTARSGFDFLRHARVRECQSYPTITTVWHGAQPKNDQLNGHLAPENVLITKDRLESVLSEGRIVAALRCDCPYICKPVTEITSHEEDKHLAKAIAHSHERRRLFATLAFMGGTFATRSLAAHNFHTVETALSGIPLRADLRRDLFLPFRSHWKPGFCRHTPPHTETKEIVLLCLQEDFLSQLGLKAWVLKVPEFRADDVVQKFGERVNTPFIHETCLPMSNRGSGREFFSFNVHPEYCEEKLQGRLLFRKQLSIDTPKKLERAKQEGSILKFLKDLANPNIAEVLFAFQEACPPRLNLVFYFQPTDLEKILYPQTDPDARFHAPQTLLEKFPGSKLNHWMWIGILGIFDAVAAIHDPQNHSTSIPKNTDFSTVGGHFDIKPANIMVDARGRFLLTDFGQAFFKNLKAGQESNFSIYPGTLDYKPPRSHSKLRTNGSHEGVQGEWWSRSYDVWSLACISVEVLAYIIKGKDAPTQFRNERKRNDRQELGTFYDTINTHDGLKDVLKGSVGMRLTAFRNYGDEYLTRVAEQVEKMFQIEGSRSLTVKACQQELSASVKVDRYVFKAQNDEILAGEGTYMCLSAMRTSFTTDRVSALRCSLYMWRNILRNRFTLTLEFDGSDKQKFVTPYSTDAGSDEIVPLAFFDPDTIFDQNLFRTNGLSLQCAFRNMHDGVIFHFARLAHYSHLFGAFTSQYIVSGSEFRFKSCMLESASKMRSKTWSSTSGHAHIWMNLVHDRYKSRYIEPQTPLVPSISLPKIPRSEDTSPKSSASITRPYIKGSTPINPHFRLALYFCEEPKTLVVLSLTNDCFDISFDKSPKGMPRMVLTKKSENNFLAAVTTRPAMGPVSLAKHDSLMAVSMNGASGPSHRVDECPGIPMSEERISTSVKNGEKLRKLEVKFWNEDDQKRFKSIYHTKLKLRE